MFIDYKCDGARYVKGNSVEAIICPLDGAYCPHTGYCPVRKKVRFTNKATSCKKRENYRKENYKNV